VQPSRLSLSLDQRKHLVDRCAAMPPHAKDQAMEVQVLERVSPVVELGSWKKMNVEEIRPDS